MKIKYCPALWLLFLFVLLLPSLSAAGQSSLRIIHLNDFHGFAEPHKPYGSGHMQGGAEALASVIDELRKERPSLLLAAGDMIQGNGWANLFQGESVIGLMNELKFDAMVAGNHEFDFGQDVLKKRISQASFPVLGANVRGISGLRPYVIKKIDGISVAIIGVVTEDTPMTTHPKNTAGLRFDPPAEVLNRLVSELRPKVDLIIVLSHLGHGVDRMLAGQIKGIDVIVGGHSHTKVSAPVMTGKTAVVQAWEHGKAVGVLDIYFDGTAIREMDGRLVDILPGQGREDMKMAAIVRKYRAGSDALLDNIIGHAEAGLDGENTRKRETDLGNLVADVLKKTAGADAAIIGGGSIRTGLGRGAIRAKDIYSVLPFNNYIISVRLKGGQIREMLEHGVSAVEDAAGRFPQVSGISFSYSRNEPAGERVQDIFVNGRLLESQKEYIVATDDFIAAGGDGYTVPGSVIRSSGGPAYTNTGRRVRDAVIEFIETKKNITPLTDGRISVID